ncbi:RHS repeat domain-containing protein [Treponema sp.]|uniref:RHS repeat domain-containing protein n=1 Tax=Treponema sp. TaxID=166 RepID=UPI00388E707F
MKTKKSSEVTVTGSKKGDDLNYEFDYEIEEGYAHRYSRIGNRYYKYDEVGNIVMEQDVPFSEDDTTYTKVEKLKDKVWGMNEGWGYFSDAPRSENSSAISKKKINRRTYEWNAENQLTGTTDESLTVNYTYGADGKRASKYTHSSETLYFNDYWIWHIDSATRSRGGKVTKNIYLGTERVASRIGSYNTYYGEEKENTFFYHPDHLGSAQLVTDHSGNEYQRLEYTPYGETWIDLKAETSLILKLPYKFSAKELDEETGLYYYGARYLDPRMSRWISADPAMNTGEYFSNPDAGMGGIYNHVNFNLYHYAGNNPIRYTDPDGRFFNRPEYHNKQNGLKHTSVTMGKTPSGKYEIDENGSKTVTKQNTIGAFGCLFTEIYNNAMTARKKRTSDARRYCEQHNIPFYEPSLESFAGNDKYFNYYDHANDTVNPRNETDANMDRNTIEALYEDVSGKKANHIMAVTKQSTITVLLKVIKDSPKGVTVIGRCNGHFFTILNVNNDGGFTGEDGELDLHFIHDPQINKGTPGYEKFYKDFYNKLKLQGPDRIWVID